MWIQIRPEAGTVYIGRKNKPFAMPGEKANVSKRVGEALVEAGLADAIPVGKEAQEDAELD